MDLKKKKQEQMLYTNELVSKYLLEIINKDWFPEIANVFGRLGGPKFVQFVPLNTFGFSVNSDKLTFSYTIPGLCLIDGNSVSNTNEKRKSFAVTSYDYCRLVDKLCLLIPTRPDVNIAQQKHQDLYKQISELGNAYANQKSYSKRYVESVLDAMLQYK